MNYGLDLYTGKNINNQLVLVDEPSAAISSEVRLPISMFSSLNGDISEGRVVSDGSAGFLLFGPHATLESGSFLATAQLELLNPNDAPDRIGKVDIAFDFGEHIHSVLELNREEFVDGRYQLYLPFIVESNLEYFEFRIFTEENVVLQVSDIAMQLVGE